MLAIGWGLVALMVRGSDHSHRGSGLSRGHGPSAFCSSRGAARGRRAIPRWRSPPRAARSGAFGDRVHAGKHALATGWPETPGEGNFAVHDSWTRIIQAGDSRGAEIGRAHV